MTHDDKNISDNNKNIHKQETYNTDLITDQKENKLNLEGEVIFENYNFPSSKSRFCIFGSDFKQN